MSRTDAMPPGAQAIDAAGERLWLLPGHAVHWPAARTLFAADVHLGKAASFRALGQPVPTGTTAGNLARLDAVLASVDAGRLVFLGDLLHARAAHNPALRQAVREWRARHAHLDLVLVRGNHDDHAGDPPAEWSVEVVDEPWALGPLRGFHHPPAAAAAVDTDTDADTFWLAGHEHPVCHLQGSAHDHLRLPCFVRRAGGLVLPAFGEFTGGMAVRADGGQRLYPVGGGRVWAL